ncbi:hypothetical protein [Haladaptatus sp. NG-SE-30]
MNNRTTRRTLLRQIATGATATTVVTATANSQTDDRTSEEIDDRAVEQTVPDETDGPARLLYTCDITAEDDPTPDVNDRLLVERVEGTFGPTESGCFREEKLIFRYLFTKIEQGEPSGRQGIVWSTRQQLPRSEYRIANIFVCDEAPSGYCAIKPFYGIVIRET